MPSDPRRSTPGVGGQAHPASISVTRFLAAWLSLTALMAIPYGLLDAATASLAAGGIALVYFLWLWVSNLKKRPKASATTRWTRFHVGLYQAGGSLAAPILIGVVLYAWMATAFDLSELLGSDRKIMARSLALAIFLMTASYLGGLVLLRRRRAISGNLTGFIWADLVGLPRSPLVLPFAFTMAVIGLASTAASAVAMELLAASLIPDHAPTILDVVGIFPILPFGLLAGTALLSLAGRLLAWDDPACIRKHLEGGAVLPAWPGVMTAGASIVTLIAIVYPIHFGMVAALSTVDGVGPSQTTKDAVAEWVAAQRDKGLGSDDIAARLNDHGRWSPDAPDAGLATLLPELGAELADADADCEIAVAAAATDPSALAAIDWMPAETARSTFKYCLRVACPSPVTWQAPPALLLSSSHPSQNRYWVETTYFDVFADGVAAAPGGFCTADGQLAEDFQG